MLHKTRGIVLNYIKYRETSIIVKIFTELFGLNSYIVNGVRSAKAKNKIALYQPLTILDLVVYHKKNTGLNRISEIKCSEPLMDIPINIKKSSIALFITDLLNKTIKENDENVELFEFLYQSVLVLEHLQHHYENFHLQFILKLSRYLGFSPVSAQELINELNAHVSHQSLTDQEMEILNELIDAGYKNDIHLSNEFRRVLLHKLILFYKLHVDFPGEIKSLTVLHEVLND
ncbi:DNA repair protein RecO [Fulvivirgaceae bacterium BMA10]|uniref:DNA repair protein RecO n=1 Tax=Splendidivirga corallicola TaxID=3051826 RepID=A0ABT8KRE0_9BACT|nr:DNA repair protein RecO [Fulvivirgaceae bacterium BMA10]